MTVNLQQLLFRSLLALWSCSLQCLIYYPDSNAAHPATKNFPRNLRPALTAKPSNPQQYKIPGSLLQISFFESGLRVHPTGKKTGKKFSVEDHTAAPFKDRERLGLSCFGAAHTCRYSRMLSAARRPSAMAVTTRSDPRTASPPANTFSFPV